jgi:hypothetical protein
MAFGKKFDKSKLKEKRKQQNPLFKRKKFCRFTVANVEQVDYKDVDTLKDFRSREWQDHACSFDWHTCALSASSGHRYQACPLSRFAALYRFA